MLVKQDPPLPVPPSLSCPACKFRTSSSPNPSMGLTPVNEKGFVTLPLETEMGLVRLTSVTAKGLVRLTSATEKDFETLPSETAKGSVRLIWETGKDFVASI